MTAAKPLTRDEWERLDGLVSGERVTATIDALAAAERERDDWRNAAEKVKAQLFAWRALLGCDEHHELHEVFIGLSERGRMLVLEDSPLAQQAKRALAERDALTQALAARDEAIAELNRELDASVADGVAQIRELTAQVDFLTKSRDAAWDVAIADLHEATERVRREARMAMLHEAIESLNAAGPKPGFGVPILVAMMDLELLATKPQTADAKEKP